MANLSESVDPSGIHEVTEELISLKIAQFRPDLIVKEDKVIIMFEFESSYVGMSSRKRFHAYVALYDLERNDENLDICFCVITTKEKSKVIEHKIGDVDNFKIRIFNIRDLGFEQIINNAYDRIEKQEVLSLDELVELALTSLMPGTREGNIDQFYELSEMVDLIVFDCEDDEISFVGLLLLLSEIYFDINDPICKKIRGVLMNRVDSIAKLCKEKYTEGLMFTARNLLLSGLSVDFVCENTTLPPEKVKELEKEVKASK